MPIDDEDPPVNGNWYDSVEEASLRLAQTIVQYDNQPCFVSQVFPHDDGNIRLAVDILTPELILKTTRKVIGSKYFNFKPILDGYSVHELMGGDEIPSYIARIPSRRPQQGMCAANTTRTTLKGSAKTVSNFNAPEWVGVKKFWDTFYYKKYKPLPEAFQQALKSDRAVPFASRFAVKMSENGSMTLFGQNFEPIGFFTQRKQIQLKPDSRFMVEMLQAAMGDCKNDYSVNS